MKNFIQSLIKFLYPPRCGFCRKIILGSEDYLLCDECSKKVKFIGNDTCQKCGKVLNLGYRDLCADCRMIIHHFDRAYSAVEYSDEVKGAVIRYKFFGQKKVSKTLAALALTKLKEIGKVDMILPVPLHKEKMMQRGFNQSELIASHIAEKTGIILNTASLVRIRNTISQSTLSRQERLKNLQKAFKSQNSGLIMGKNLLLVDDVYTTGSTVSECAKVLKDAGANEVYVLTVASGRGY